MMAAFAPAGDSRLRSLLAFWIGTSVTAAAVIWFIAAAMSYPCPGAQIDPSGHPIRAASRNSYRAILIVYARGVGCRWGIAPVLRCEVAIRSAVIGGAVLFGIVYAPGCTLAGA